MYEYDIYYHYSGNGIIYETIEKQRLWQKFICDIYIFSINAEYKTMLLPPKCFLYTLYTYEYSDCKQL